GGGLRGDVVGAGVLEAAELVDGAGAGPQPVALAQQGTGLDEAQGQALGLEPQVPGPVRLVLGEAASDDVAEQVESGRAVESGQRDLLDARLGGRGGHVGGRAEQEGALGAGVQQRVEGRAAGLQVVHDDDGADLPHAGEQFVPFGPVQRGAVHGVEEVLEQVVDAAAEAVEPDDAVGGEVGAVVGDDVEQPGAAGAAGAGEAHGAAAGQQPDKLFALVLAGQQRRGGPRGAGRDGRPGGAFGLGAAGGVQLDRAAGPFGGRARLDLAAVDRVDGEQEVAGDQLHRA